MRSYRHSIPSGRNLISRGLSLSEENPVSEVVVWPPPSEENPIKRGVWMYELQWMDVLQ